MAERNAIPSEQMWRICENTKCSLVTYREKSVLVINQNPVMIGKSKSHQLAPNRSTPQGRENQIGISGGSDCQKNPIRPSITIMHARTPLVVNEIVLFV